MMTQAEFLAKCADYPAYDYECLDCSTEIYGVIADLKNCPHCKSANITYVGIPQGDVQL